MRDDRFVLVSLGVLSIAVLALSGCSGGGGFQSTGGAGDLAAESAAPAPAAAPAATTAAASPGAATSAGLQPYLIGFKQTPGPAEEALLKSHNGAVKFTYHLIPVIAASLPPQAVEGLTHNPKIAYIEPDAEAQATADTVPWGVTRVKADQVWPTGNVATGIKVAIIDTGIDRTHPDLASNFAGGYDYVNGDSDPMDDNGHGTHVSGTVAAAADGALVEGVGPRARLYGVKVLNASGSGSYSNIIAALQWCVDNGMQIGSMSLGGSSGSSALQAACDAAYNGGVLLVAAAGNSGRPNGKGDTVGYPAKYASVIAVAATDSSDKRASWSSTGSTVELAAPGVSVVSDRLGGGTTTMSGTSMACPHVTGTAALVIASGVTGPAAVRQKLDSTATDLGATGRDTWYGYGLVNAARATGVTP